MSSLKPAQAALEQLTAQRGDKFYPQFHLAPPAGWMNDPNGLIYFDGLYHAFYQHHPYSVDWGPMHWGHATSPDMIHWTHQPIALAPDTDADRDGCFSGCAVEDQGQLALIYTGHRWLGAVGDDTQIHEVQCLALSRDGIHFEKQGMILTPPEGVMHFRDPKVWFEAGEWWMVVGARSAEDQGQVLLYRGASLTQWQFDRVLAAADVAEGYMWECPDFFRLGGQQYLMCSPQGIAPQEERFANLYQSGVIAGDWQPGTDFIRREPFTELDQGHDFYAPQSFVAADGRRIIMAWMDMWEAPMPGKQEGWCGSLTLPRELCYQQGQLRQHPVAEVAHLRQSLHSLSAQEINGEHRLQPVDSGLEIQLEWQSVGSEAQAFGLRLGSGLELVMEPEVGRLTLHRNYPDYGIEDQRSLTLDESTTLHWQIFIDRSSIEIFINQGAAVFTSRIYPTSDDRVLSLFSDLGATKLLQADFWSLSR